MGLQIACAADAEYLPHAAAMLHSLLVLHGEDAPVIHFLYNVALPPEPISRLGDFVEAMGGQWCPHAIGRDLLRDFPHNWRFSREAWYRVLLPELLPDAARVLYLDADTIVLRSLHDLWATDLGENIIGAVANPLYGFMDIGFIAALGLEHTHEYFNSGVLLIDLARWRAQGISRRLHTFVAEHGAAQQWPDQNALNAVLRGRWLPLDPVWNAQNVYFDLKPTQLPCSREQVQLARAAPAVVHFVAPYKPWDYLCKHLYRDHYFQHLAATPWRDRVPIRGVTWVNRVLRLLPQPFMWVALARLRHRWRALRSGAFILINKTR